MTNPRMIDPNNPITAGAIIGLAIILLIVLLGWMGNRDRDAQSPKCPAPNYGQQLIGRGHMETDGESGELQCTYSTAPIHSRMVAGR